MLTLPVTRHLPAVLRPANHTPPAFGPVTRAASLGVGAGAIRAPVSLSLIKPLSGPRRAARSQNTLPRAGSGAPASGLSRTPGFFRPGRN
jgi:hypothetical protein